MNCFLEKHGSFICRKLLNGCDFTSPEGRREFNEKDYLNQVCKQCVQDVVEILENII